MELPAAVCALILGGQRNTRTGPLNRSGNPRRVCRKASRNAAGDLYFPHAAQTRSTVSQWLRM